MLIQASLVSYVLSKAVAYDRLAVPAIFVFVTGIIKYGERIWALKQGSKKYLTSSSRGEAARSSELQQRQGATGLMYPIIVKRALDCEENVRYLFAGQTLSSMSPKLRWSFLNFDEEYHGEGDDSELVFKRIEVELSIMYDLLFTKYRIIHTTFGTVLGCVSFTSTMVALVLFIMMGAKQTYKFSLVDTTITYVLFIGAICLEGCSAFILMMSPQTWATLEARGCHLLARVAWSILVKMKPETRPWWSNSMGQYNLVDSCMAGNKSAGSFFTKMVGMVGLGELWHKMRHIKYVQVPTRIKQLIDKTCYEFCQDSELAILRLPVSMSQFKVEIDKCPFVVALLRLHIRTEFWLQNMHVSAVDISEETQKLMDQSKVISDYMIHLLVVNPAMLPVDGEVDEHVAYFKEGVRGNIEASLDITNDDFFTDDSGFHWRALQGLEERHAFFGVLQQVWVRLLMYAAGKCHPEEHARRLSMGGELLTLVWLAMLHREMGDQAGLGLQLMLPGDELQVSTSSATVNYPLFGH
jgi:hypothetical protein